ncbi:unnamed protein product [Cladocopium goreaui]|nr:unnamed protein product [Cladocopium goreaui]|mmetsp:Transcript_39758/g.86008  ORF Transcript_39758/g.86008 Transcript_39758/m.86008 type:complete len:155 (-) Transcript_39758:34-498(-)
MLRAAQRLASRSSRLPVPCLLGLDHAAIGVKDLKRSLAWYHGVLGLRHMFVDDPMFNGPIAMVGVNDIPLLALLRLPDNEQPLVGSREQRGHFALRTKPEDFETWRESLPDLLRLHRAHDLQSLWLEEQDYGRQRSLFFQDPDTNEIEVAAWFR